MQLRAWRGGFVDPDADVGPGQAFGMRVWVIQHSEREMELAGRSLNQTAAVAAPGGFCEVIGAAICGECVNYASRQYAHLSLLRAASSQMVLEDQFTGICDVVRPTAGRGVVDIGEVPVVVYISGLNRGDRRESADQGN